MSEHENKSPGAERQMQVFLGGLQGVKPDHPFSFFDLERRAREVMDDYAWGYVEPGAGEGDTTDSNQEAFLDWEIVPRILGDVSSCRLDVDLFGQKLRSPILLAPIGMQGIVHPEGESASGRASASMAMPFVLSTVSSKSIEEVAQVMGPMPRWFQLYWGTRRDVVVSMVERAEQSGYGAIVVTADTKMIGWRDADLQNAFLPVMRGEGLANYFTDPQFRRTLSVKPEVDSREAVSQFAQISTNLALTWDDIDWLRQQTALPVLVKGILHPDDARMAVNRGVDGVIVSNHGGRQVDGAVAALRALPDVADAVGGAIPVLFDSGIRRASHIVKALALGAKAVLIGRPYVYGLAINGEQGVRDVLHNLLGELDVTMRLSGFTSLDALGPQCLRRV